MQMPIWVLNKVENKNYTQNKPNTISKSPQNNPTRIGAT